MSFSFLAHAGDGHALTFLWKKYDEAHAADRPQKEAEILLQIREAAASGRHSLDFFDAGRKYVEAVERRNWKERGKAHAAWEEWVREYDEPIVTYAWMKAENRSGRQAYVLERLDDFKGIHRAFHEGTGTLMGGALNEFIQDDREYVLWDLLNGQYSYTNIASDPVYKALSAQLGDRYPNAAYLEYFTLARRMYGAPQPLVEGFVEKYKGRAIAFWGREILLYKEFEQLQRNKDATGSDYKAFCDKCRAFEKERKALRGKEARIAAGCDRAADYIETLNAKELSVGVDKNRVVCRLQNLDKVTLTMARGKEVLRKWTLANPVKTFYLTDTVTLAIPEVPDGEYVFRAVNGKLKDEAVYEQYTLSVGTRQDSRGLSVYVADYRSGEPLPQAHIVLKYSGKEVAATDMKLTPSFNLLPEAFQKAFQQHRYFDLYITRGDRKSKEVSLYREDWKDDNTWMDGTYCHLYRDRGAYNPGDEIAFKAVLYQGNLVDKVGVVPGKELEAVLINSENKEIGREKLTTNEFGSVSGRFTLPKDQRNGHFTLRILSEGRSLASDSFPVDEFVLPTFTLSFEKLDKLCLVGEEVTFRGRLESYSGHPLTEAVLLGEVRRYGSEVWSGEVAPDKDGSFEVHFKAESSGYHRLTVRVQDATGETQEFSTGIYVANSIRVGVDVNNQLDGEFSLPAGVGRGRYILVAQPAAKLVMTVYNSDSQKVPLPVSWALTDRSGKAVSEGKVDSGTELDLALPSPGVYLLKAWSQVEGTTIKDTEELTLLRLDPEATALPGTFSRVLFAGEKEVAEGGEIQMGIGASDGPLWAVATLYGKGRTPLAEKLIALDGSGHTFERVSFTYEAAYPDAVRLGIFYFRDGDAVFFEREFSRIRTRLSLPLSVHSFRNTAFPGTEYSFSWKTDPEVEAVVAVYDKSIDAICPNPWPIVTLRDFSVPYVGTSSVTGHVGGVYHPRFYLEKAAARGGQVLMAAAEPMMMESKAMVSNDMTDGVAAEESEAAAEAVSVREKFETALAFEPHLRSGKDGLLSLTFRTSDKLSTYYVSVYAHDRQMRNAFLREEMVVSVPVKVSLAEPRFLYEGDLYNAAVTVSSNASVPQKGQLYLYTYPKDSWQGVEPVKVQRKAVTVPAGGVVKENFAVKAAGKAMGLKAVFVADKFSDAVFVPIPVLEARQSLTEAHSAVWREGMDKKALIARLRKQFVNVPGSKAAVREISIIDMVREAIPTKAEPAGKDVLSLSEAWYVRRMAERISTLEAEKEDLLPQILACRNADGGFGWFEGMHSSAMITAVMLERFAKLRDRGVSVPDMARTVAWLDRYQFGDEKPLWCGWVTDAQYMYVRSLYAGVPFEVKADTKEQKERMTGFKKYAKDYLVPSKERGLQGQILAKARRIKTLLALSASSEGIDLARQWGVSVAVRSKMEKSLEADILSLVEYAVEHKDGGWYYPNAVMPWRGLLESEAYAHSLLCDLLSSLSGDAAKAENNGVRPSGIADGIRLWLMLQKETQKWDEEPAFVDALTSILDGSEAVLSTEVIALEATYAQSFAKIKAAGNGFSIAREFYRDGTLLKPGDPVKLGDKITVKYVIWNAENRSFVKLNAFREAALRPVDQLSGHIGWGFRPLYYGSWSISPQGYRNVKAAVSEYYFDSYPEENTTITEEFFVTQDGSFTAPVVTIESLYAPHYRANDGFHGILTSR